MATQITGLAPILPGYSVADTTVGLPRSYRPTLLILGSMPSVRSLAQQQYYGHPQNHFWPMIEALFGIDRARPYAERCQALAERGIVLWDVIGSCERPGSMDAAIKPDSIIANDIPGLLAQHRSIRTIGCNGGAAFDTLRRHYPTLTETHTIVKLLSSSPANARYRPIEKAEQWRAALNL